MNTFFSKTSANWIKYSGYECREIKKGDERLLYVMPSESALPSVYNPLDNPEQLVLDALNVGMLAMRRDGEKEMQEAVLGFVSKYGLLGFMPALPTTAHFMDYKAVYLPKNHFIRDESMTTQKYLSYFFPYKKPDISKSADGARWNVSSEDFPDREVLAAAMTFSDPMAVGMCLLPLYAERYDWLVTQFKDWAFMLVSTHFYYDDSDGLSKDTRDLYRLGAAAFGSRVPTYHIGLFDDSPKIVWDFHSLLLTIQTMLAFVLTDEKRKLRLCKKCTKVFVTEKADNMFCSAKCKKQYSTQKSEQKKIGHR